MEPSDERLDVLWKVECIDCGDDACGYDGLVDCC